MHAHKQHLRCVFYIISYLVTPTCIANYCSPFILLCFLYLPLSAMNIISNYHLH